MGVSRPGSTVTSARAAFEVRRRAERSRSRAGRAPVVTGHSSWHEVGNGTKKIGFAGDLAQRHGSALLISEVSGEERGRNCSDHLVADGGG